MKNSNIQWIGDIPDNWEIVKGKHCFRLVQRPTKQDDEVITCFRDGMVTLRKNRREEGFTISTKEFGYQGIEVGDLIVHGMDGFAGAIGISDSRGKASPVLNVLDTIGNKKYYMYLLRSMAYNGVFEALSTGIRVRTCDTNWGKLKDLVYCVPPLATQTTIATYLDAKCSEIDGLIADINKQIETLNELKKSTITEAVTKGLDKNVKLKDSGIQWIGMIPEGWSVTKLKYIFDYIRRGQTPNYVEKSNCRIVNQATFSKFYFDREKQKYTANCAYNENFVRKKDVLMASTGGGVLGKVFYYNLDYNDSIADSHVTILRTTNNIESKFYFYTLSILFEWINVNLAEGSTNQTELQRDLLGNSFYPVPPLAEQHAIATYLDSKCSEFDSIISDKQKQISTLEAYKKSLIYEYVTGKKEVG